MKENIKIIKKESTKFFIFLVILLTLKYLFQFEGISIQIPLKYSMNEFDLFKKTYILYLRFFLRIGYLFIFIYLIKNLCFNLKNKCLTIGIFYFIIGIFLENIGILLPLKKIGENFYLIGTISYCLGSLSLLSYFMSKFFKSEKQIEYLLIGISAIFFSNFKFNILELKEGLNIYLEGIIFIFIILNLFLLYLKKDYIERIESIIFLGLFSIQAIFYIFIFKFFYLENFEIISLIILNFLIVGLKKEEYQRKINQKLNLNYLRIFFMFIGIGIFSRILDISGSLTIFLVLLIVEELLFFIFSVEKNYNLQIFSELLKKAKLIETREKMIEFLEENLLNYFRFVDIKIILNSNALDVKYEKYIIFNVEYNGTKYDIEVKLIENLREIGRIYIKDSCLLLNKTKLKTLLYLIEELIPILENLLLKEIQMKYYKINKEEIVEKNEQLEKENFYLREILKLNNKRED